MGCEVGQGDLWARPMGAEQARGWMDDRFAEMRRGPVSGRSQEE